MKAEEFRFVRCLARALFLLLFLAPGTQASTTFEARRYLFLDPSLLASTQNLEITINPADRREIVIRPDRPWESLMFGFFSTILQEDDRVRLWYLARAREGRAPSGMAYAESRDGVHFTKPSLGLVDYEGSRDNNLVKGGTNGLTPFIDPNAPPEERYVAVSNIPRGGMGRYTSPDGFRWKHDLPGFIPVASDTQNVTFWDQRLGKYVVYLRSRVPNYRDVKRLEVSSLTVPSGVKRREDLPTVFGADENDPVRSEVYSMVAQPYPLDPSWYVAFPAFLRRSAASDRPDYGGLGHHRGPVATEFTGSRDGIKWHRYDRTAYASPMMASPEKRNMLFMGWGLVVRGDEIWQYATEFESEHGDVEAREKKQDGVIVRFVQRVDGFVSLTAGNTEGTGRTVPVRVTGDQLLLNVDTGALGEIQVGLLDENGRAMTGFSLEDCPPLQINATGVPVAWPKGELATLKGKSVCLEIRMRRARLFSFRFE